MTEKREDSPVAIMDRMTMVIITSIRLNPSLLRNILKGSLLPVYYIEA